MAKRQKLSFVELDDLPDEIILKIFTFLDIKEILKCGQISQRIRAISNDESLWLQLNFFEGHVPYGLLEKAVENGCRYLSLAFACLVGGENSKIPLNLSYLEMSQHSDNEPGTLEVHKGLLRNCHSLQKLAMENLILDSDDIEDIGNNFKTLKILDLEDICIGHIYPNPTKAIQKLFKRCVELVEINFSNSLDYESKLFTAMASNLTPKIKKVDLSRNENLKDRHVKILVQRCNQISELDLSFTSITKDSVDSIAAHLNSSLEKLDVSYTEIDSTALLQLRSVGTLKVLYCLKHLSGKKIEKIKIKNLRKNLPQLSINKWQDALSSIAASTDTFDFENGLWEIKAEAQFVDLNCS